MSDGRQWITGNEYTLADVSMTPVFERLRVSGWSFLIDDLPNVKKYWERLQTRPSYKQAITEHNLTCVTLAS